MARQARAYGYTGGYLWGSAAPAYREPGTRRERERRDPQRERDYGRESGRAQSQRRTHVDVVSGGRRASQVRYLSLAVLTFAKGLAILFCVVAIVGVARVALNSIAATSAMQAQEISQELTAARSAGNALEVRLGVAANSNHIKSAANALGMAAATYTEVIALPEDVVALDEAGNLSLSLSVQRLIATG